MSPAGTTVQFNMVRVDEIGVFREEQPPDGGGHGVTHFRSASQDIFGVCIGVEALPFSMPSGASMPRNGLSCSQCLEEHHRN